MKRRNVPTDIIKDSIASKTRGTVLLILFGTIQVAPKSFIRLLALTKSSLLAKRRMG